jgi:hypothetical protein
MVFRNGVKKLLSKSSRSEEMAHVTESTGAKPVVGMDAQTEFIACSVANASRRRGHRPSLGRDFTFRKYVTIILAVAVKLIC